MDGDDKKSGTKKRSKQIEIGIGSNDDEPIGSLLKLKRARNPKKVKPGLEGTVGRGKRGGVGDEDLGGMDDTLAILWKKLKVSKKDLVSGTIRGKTSASVVIESSDPPVEEGGSDAKSVSKGAGKGSLVEDGGSDMTVDIGVENKPKGKVKRPRVNSNTKTDDVGLESMGSGCSLLKDKNVSGVLPEEGTSHSSNDRLEDSLSSLLRRAQSGVTRKSRPNSSLKGSHDMSRDRSSSVESMRSNDREQNRPSKVIPECYSKVIRDEAMMERSSTAQEGLAVDPCSPSKVCDGDSRLSPGQKAASETCIVKDGLNHCSAGEEITLNCGQNEFDYEPCTRGQRLMSCSDSDLLKEETCTNCNGPDTYTEEQDDASGNLQKESAVTCNGGISSIHTTCTGAHELGCNFQLNGEEISLKTLIEKNESYDESAHAIYKCCSALHQNLEAQDTTCVSVGEETHGGSPLSVAPDENESYQEDTVSLPDTENKESKLSAYRATRKHKKHRHGDMAYEGDADWETLIDEQGFLEGQRPMDSDRSFRARSKSNPSSSIVTDGEGSGAAAVSAGLKAHAVGPIEKIKFKEILKRRGGLQDYLECRNQILGLWNKDVSRILPLSDCGVTEKASANESPHDSLLREIYAFLDQSGYINFGIASEKENAESGHKQNYKLLREKNFVEGSGLSVADSEDGVSFIIGQVKSSKASIEAKNRLFSDGENLTHEAIKERECVPNARIESANETEPEGHFGDFSENCSINAKLAEKLVNLDVGSTELSCEILEVDQVPITTLDTKNDSCHIQPAANDGAKRNHHHLQRDADVPKKIIVIGAGPAGLTAARQLQRQGFSVTILEARSRIGGRVYTDRSSLSVPVDLGASIITGVEADVDTERRPDPSSLICAQLGVELTILNSDCPLYDIVTAQKVPSDLDEALEAEYNSLLDDMIFLVAQKGEHATKMSLEEGLEYALQRRRMARVGVNVDEKKHDLAVDGFVDLKTSSDGRVPGKNYSTEELLSPLERRVMDWHFANLEYGCAALLKEVSLPYWNQDDVYGGFGGAHCMIKGGYSTVIESLGEGLCIHLKHVVTDISYSTKVSGVLDGQSNKVRVSTSNGGQFHGDAVLVTVPLGCLKAETIKFSPPLPQWKQSSVQRLGFGILNKVVLEFPDVFWDDSVDYFGATAEETDRRGQCFMFWNVKKTVGAPVLIALLVGKAAIDGQNMFSSDHVNHALVVLRKLFGEEIVPDPVASVVTDWGRDPFSYGAYSYVAVGASGEDYDILGRPVENCLFFAGEATCKEHPDTVGGAMMSGLREAVRIIDILTTGNDYTAEVEAMEAVHRQSEFERDEVRDIARRLDAVELSNVLYKDSLDGTQSLTREALLQDMFFNAKTNAARLHLVKELLTLPVETLKSFAGTKEGLSTLNSWILDSMGKDGTQLLRHCVRLLVLVSTDLLAVRLSGIGKTVKEKVCVHTSRDIRGIASQLVNVWLEVFRKEKASNGGLKFSRQSATKSVRDPAAKPPLHTNHGALVDRGNIQVSASNGSHLSLSANVKKVNGKVAKLESATYSKPENNSLRSQGSTRILDTDVEDGAAMTEEEKAAIAAAEAARAAALAAVEAYASSEAKSNTLLQLPKIPSFHKFARREQYAQMDEYDFRRKLSGGVLGRQDCLSEIDSRNCRVRNWSVDFSATCVNLDNSRILADNLSQRSHSNEIASHLNFKEHSGESAAADSSIYTKAWVDTAGSVGVKDYHAIERWQSQAAAADPNFFDPVDHVRDEEDSNASSRQPTWKCDGRANESSVSQVTMNKESVKSHHRGADRIKQAVVDYVASLLMPLYKAKKIDREGYKSIMKKSATKVMEQATDAEKAMAVSEFLDFKRRNKIRAFVDTLIERHMASKPSIKM
ncbi:LOW QUALITY PROTEIN: lysine-specific histone demethylase 1 homolog 3 [Morus notabilis]|uniref:LOW QUALITY PROTEIN: lysine-specific histone demethylase 1 homolog 3 n=1 Tax=Morus notabilis TaxID=981085 RepID=UPI000CED6635|nr:LOW QUALITY PROTEIN: lysine-specific histone demethylase 1 homolog 3 [Morus notabilis]